MFIKGVVFLVGLLLVKADLQTQTQLQTGGPLVISPPLISMPPPSILIADITQLTNQAVKNQQTLGNSAAAGNAQGLGSGAASSINQATQQAGNGLTAASGLSANTATGTEGATAGGAATAGGQVATQEAINQMLAHQATVMNDRGKRQAVNLRDLFNSAEASALGGGSAKLGKLLTQNNAFTRTDQISSLGFANGLANGEGEGISIFDAANTRANSRNSQRVARDVFSEIQNLAETSALGGGSAQLGKLRTDNNAFSRTDQQGSTGFGSGSASGEGRGISIFDAVNSKSSSVSRQNRNRRDILRQIQNLAEGGANGGGSVDLGELSTSNQGSSQSDLTSASGSGSGSAFGKGVNVKIFQNSQSKALSGLIDRLKRQTPVQGIDLQSLAEASALGGGTAELGVLSTENEAQSFSRPNQAFGQAKGKAAGQGTRISIFDNVKTNSETRGTFPFAL